MNSTSYNGGSQIIMIPINSGICFVSQVSGDFHMIEGYNCQVINVNDYWAIYFQYVMPSYSHNYGCGVQCLYDNATFTIPIDGSWPVYTSSGMKNYPTMLFIGLVSFVAMVLS